MKSLEDRLKTIKELAPESKIKRTGGRHSYINIENVIDFLNLGLRMPQIAEIYGCCTSTLSYQIKLDYPNFDGRKYVRLGKTEISDEKIKRLYERLGSSNKIAEALNLTPSGVLYRLRRMGIKVKSLYREDITVKEVVKLYKEHKNISKVMRILDADYKTIKGRLALAGIKSNLFSHTQLMRNDLPEEEIVEKYKNNISIKALAKEYHAHIRTIKRALLKNDVRIRGSREWEERTDITPEKVARAYRKLKGITAVAEALGTCNKVVYDRLEKAGVQTYDYYVSARRRKDIPDKEVIKRRHAGETLKSLAERYKTTKETISRLLDYHEVPKKGKGWAKGLKRK